MVEDGNILPQAEIDAIFKQAAVRNLETNAVLGKINPSSVVPGNKPKESRKAKTASSNNSNPQPSTSQKAGTDKSSETEKLNEIMTLLGKLTRRIENLENNISTVSQSDSNITDSSELETRLLQRIKNDEIDLHKVNKRIINILARLKETPGYGVRGGYTCNSCGSHGFIAIPMKCSNCGTQGWLGWWPD
ncbi:MAG: hypothetical protein JSU58_00580 [Dehalococcoidales bacterium]|nr:MAG: hypothetical protein JSU58_00580 [Dehalococcoidales bacterium]